MKGIQKDLKSRYEKEVTDVSLDEIINKHKQEKENEERERRIIKMIEIKIMQTRKMKKPKMVVKIIMLDKATPIYKDNFMRERSVL